MTPQRFHILSFFFVSCILAIFPCLSSASSQGYWSKRIFKSPFSSVKSSLRGGGDTSTTNRADTPSALAEGCSYDVASLTDLEKILSEIADVCSMRSPGTPQNRAYEFMMQGTPAQEADYETTLLSKWHQRFALCAMRFSFTADPYDALLNWEPGTDECQWNGVNCDDGTGLVTDVILSGEELEGTLASEIQHLSALVSLNLNENVLQGTIPTEFGGIGSLTYLSLNNNQLQGSVPTELGNLRSLKYLDLHLNEKLQGNVPSELGNLGALVHINLSDNTLSGAIPTQLGGCVALRELHLDSNKLSGDIPSELGGLSFLHSLWVYGEAMTLNAQVPTEVCQGTSMSWLHTEFCNDKEACCTLQKQ